MKIRCHHLTLARPPPSRKKRDRDDSPRRILRPLSLLSRVHSPMLLPVVAPSLSAFCADVDKQVDCKSSCPASAASHPRRGSVSADKTFRDGVGRVGSSKQGRASYGKARQKDPTALAFPQRFKYQWARRREHRKPVS